MTQPVLLAAPAEHVAHTVQSHLAISVRRCLEFDASIVNLRGAEASTVQFLCAEAGIFHLLEGQVSTVELPGENASIVPCALKPESNRALLISTQTGT